MLIPAIKLKQQTLKLISIPSKSHSNFFSSDSSTLPHLLNANHESQSPDRISPPPQQPNPNSHGPPISDRLFRDTHHKLGSYRRGDSTFYSLIEHHANSGDFRSLEMVFERMKREKRCFVEKNFILVFRAFGKAHLHRKAIELFDRMVNEFHCKQTVKSFNSVLNVIIQQGEHRHALEFYDYVINNRKNISPNVLTFNLVIKALCKSGLVSRMQIEGRFYPPSLETFNVLINGLCNKGDLARAAKLVDNLFLKGCVPNEVTYNTLIHGLCLKGKLDKAVSLLDRMLSNKLIPNNVTYGTIINGLVKQGRAVDAVHVLNAMKERGYKGNEYSYSSLISGLFREGKNKDALNLFSEMIENGCKPNIVVYSAVIDGLCKEGKPYEAEEYLFRMINKDGCFPNAFTYSSLMRGFFKAGDCDKAILVWKEMVDKGFMDNEFCYSVLIQGLCKNGKLRDALTVWKHVLVKGLTPDVVAYSSMIHGLCDGGFIKQGLGLFNEMLCKPDVVTYNIVLNALCREGNISEAVGLLNRMLDQGCDPDSVTCKILLSGLKEKRDPPVDGGEFLDELIVRLHKREMIVGACEVVEVMLRSFLHPKASTWEKVVRGVCRPKKVLAVIDKCWGELFF
ncbi:pentatricopeptide repeat-containing protein at4g20090 [Phtheirospermum japonicum]|uniref:Pentatricopeptide repeat-containing protein at4g20090 n=1 Tax=Phtheirospermum japonicum TaxID=374723 RepID=A0A830BFW3_9LAMI|nr:pentatricopeptide repeat-containing protein at4g20090 [Phtheirospermum japonicum]